MSAKSMMLGLAILLGGTWGGQAHSAEWEMYGCPEGAQQLFLDNPQGLEYMGFRFLRSDGSTCNIWGATNNTLFAESDTKQIVLKGTDAASDHAKLELTSRDYRIRRRFYKEVHPGYYTDTDPREWVDGYTDYYYTDTKEYTGQSDTASVDVRFENRAAHGLLPWETETFAFTMTGDNVKASVVNGAYKYSVKTLLETVDDRVKAHVTITPGDKLRTPIDQNALGAVLDNAQGGLQAVFTDKWASYYQGEQLEVEIEVRKNVKLWGFVPWPDHSLYKGIQSYATAASITQNIEELPLNEELQPGQQYFIKYRFRRPNSRISTDEWTWVKEPNRVIYSPHDRAVASAQGAAAVMMASAGPESVSEEDREDQARAELSEPLQAQGDEIEIDTL